MTLQFPQQTTSETPRGQTPLLELKGLKVGFNSPAGEVPVVRDVSFSINPGEVVGLVGESGSGKSVTALSLMRLIASPPGNIQAGQALFEGQDLFQLPEPAMRRIRGNRISMIFQEPMSSLNPLMPIGKQISEVFQLHQGLSKAEARKQAVAMLERVQIPAAKRRMRDFPHQLSGGMRQRVMIAMALCCNPALLIADEPTTALDVTIQHQIMDLIMQLRAEYGSAVLMITHDLGVIAETAQKMVVMYAGQVVEAGRVDEIFAAPAHPYTQALMRSVPVLGRRAKFGRQRLAEISGTVPDPANLPPGCAFCNRCEKVQPLCQTTAPALVKGTSDRFLRCHFPLIEDVIEPNSADHKVQS